MKGLVVALLLSVFPVTGAFALPEIEVSAPGPQGPLKGAMLRPEQGLAPLVLIIPGSGPTDRNGDNPYGLKTALYRLLAEGLAERGIASLRIDKRGIFTSNAAVTDPNAVTIDDYAQDVQTWVEVIRRETGVPCVWLLGHSEGGLVALVGAQGRTDVCGLILVASPGRPAGIVLRDQLRANPANRLILGPALTAIDQLEAGNHVEAVDLPPALLPLFRPHVQGFMISLLAQDPARLIAAYRKPILILQGEEDLQIGAADAEALKQAAPGARMILLPGANHILKQVTSNDRAANLATYQDPALPLAPGVIAGIADFIAASGAKSVQ